MPNPATFEPFAVHSYEVVTDDRDTVLDGVPFEQHRVTLPNGYQVAFTRTPGRPDEGHQGTKGYDEGRWEAALLRPLPENDVRRIFGLENEPAEELNDLTNDEIDSWRVVSNLDNAGAQALLDTIAERPAPVPPPLAEGVEFATADDMDAFFASLFGHPERNPEFDEEEQA